MSIINSIRWRLGWCPNQPATVVSPPGANFKLYLLVAFCILAIPAAALLLHTPSSQDVAVWVFQVDDLGTRHFIERLPAVENAAGELTLTGDSSLRSYLPAGNYHLVIQLPGQDKKFYVTTDGDYVQSTRHRLFKIHGAGALNDNDAFEALLASFDANINTDPAEIGYDFIRQADITVTK